MIGLDHSKGSRSSLRLSAFIALVLTSLLGVAGLHILSLHDLDVELTGFNALFGFGELSVELHLLAHVNC